MRPGATDGCQAKLSYHQRVRECYGYGGRYQCWYGAGQPRARAEQAADQCRYATCNLYLYVPHGERTMEAALAVTPWPCLDGQPYEHV